MAKAYKSEALTSIHDMMEGLRETGVIGKRTIQEFDEACLADAAPGAPEGIRAIREQSE